MSDEENSDQEYFESELNEENNLDYFGPVKPDDIKIDDVIDEVVDPSDAFARFAGTYYDTSNSDFSGKISKNCASKTVTAFRQTSPEEPPLIKYTRLLGEIKEMSEQLEHLKGSYTINQEAKALQKQASQLKSKLQPLKLSKKYAPFLNQHFPIKEADLHVSNISSELKKKIRDMQNKKEAKENKEEVKGLCYELYQAKPARSKTATSVASLEKRLSALQATIGNSQLQIFPDIRSTIIYVGKKLDKLDQKQLKDLQTKMDYLGRELKHLEKQKDKLASSKKSPYQQKIKQLYDTMPEWDRSGQTLPIVLQRLQSVKALVEAGKDSKGQIKAIKDGKNDVSLLLDKDVALLKKCRKQFKTSLQDVKSVCELEKDFESLAKKMQKHFN